MLQQTQVERVRPKYAAALAAAPLSGVLALWQGLGYNRRAVALHRAARLLVERHGGRVPNDAAALEALPGIGAATAAAIRAFAFDEPVVFLETNIRRVFIHEFFPRRRGIADAELRPLVAAALARRRPREWYSALMDYGTALAGRVPNPNRRSRAHVRQGPFAGSDRQVRGALLRALLARGRGGVALLAREAGAEPERARRLLADLARDGLARRCGATYAVGGGETAPERKSNHSP